MERTEIVEKFTLILGQVFNNPSLTISEEMTSSDVDNRDSLTRMMLINAIQMNFGIRFKLSELNKLRKVGDIIECISTKF